MYRRIVIVTGMPRSGTAWISMIIDSCPAVRYRQSPLFSYEFKNRCNEHSSKSEWERLFHDVYCSNNEFMDQTHRRQSGEFPSFSEKSESPEVLLMKFDRFQNCIPALLNLFEDLKIVAIIRNPCGAMHSWLTAPKEFPQGADPLKYWRSGTIKKENSGDHFGFDDWIRLSIEHLKLARQFATRFSILRYEEMVKDPIRKSQELFAFLDLPFSNQTRDFLTRSQATHHKSEYAVYKNPAVADRWQKELIPEIREAILKELSGTELEKFCKD